MDYLKLFTYLEPYIIIFYGLINGSVETGLEEIGYKKPQSKNL